MIILDCYETDLWKFSEFCQEKKINPVQRNLFGVLQSVCTLDRFRYRLLETLSFDPIVADQTDYSRHFVDQYFVDCSFVL